MIFKNKLKAYNLEKDVMLIELMCIGLPAPPAKKRQYDLKELKKISATKYCGDYSICALFTF